MNTMFESIRKKIGMTAWSILIAVASVILLWSVWTWIHPGRRDGAVMRGEEEGGSFAFKVRLYFLSEDGLWLKAEERVIEGNKDRCQLIVTVVRELVSGPQHPPLSRSVPEQTHLNRVYLNKDGHVFLDFTELPFMEKGSILSEWTAVTALTETIRTNFPEVRRVFFLRNGEVSPGILPHLYVGRALDSDHDLIR